MQLPGDDPLARHSLSPGELKALLVAERGADPFFAYRDASAQLMIFVLGNDSRVVTIGRHEETDLSVAWDREVSGLHAELQCLGGVWTIADDDLSTNGTYLNSERIRGRRRLHDADRVRVGQTVLAFNAVRFPPTDKTTAAGPAATIPHVTDSQRRVLVALCRPAPTSGSFSPLASNDEIARDLFLSVDAVKMHLRTLYARFELGDMPPNQKRARLADLAMRYGIVNSRDLS